MRRLEQCREILIKYLIYAFPSEVTVNYFSDLINSEHLVIFRKKYLIVMEFLLIAWTNVVCWKPYSGRNEKNK